MSTDATTPVPAAPGGSALPQFDATREAPVAPPQVPYSYPSAHPTPEDRTGAAATPVAAPSGDGPRWSAKKTAVTAGLAIVLASAGAIGAAAALPAGSPGGDSGRFGRGFAPGGPNGQNGFTPFGRGNQGFGNQNGQGNLNQLPGPGGLNLGGIDPNQLSQLDPQDLLKQLDRLTGGSDDRPSSTT